MNIRTNRPTYRQTASKIAFEGHQFCSVQILIFFLIYLCSSKCRNCIPSTSVYNNPIRQNVQIYKSPLLYERPKCLRQDHGLVCCLFICLSVCRSVCMSVCTSVCLFVCVGLHVPLFVVSRPFCFDGTLALGSHLIGVRIAKGATYIFLSVQDSLLYIMNNWKFMHVSLRRT